MAGFSCDLVRRRLVCEQRSRVECWAATCVGVQVRVFWMCVCVACGRGCGRAQGVYAGTVVTLLQVLGERPKGLACAHDVKP